MAPWDSCTRFSRLLLSIDNQVPLLLSREMREDLVDSPGADVVRSISISLIAQVEKFSDNHFAAGDELTTHPQCDIGKTARLKIQSEPDIEHMIEPSKPVRSGAPES